MKNVTEFPVHTLTKGISAKTALAAEGKTPEEIQTSLGESFKFEGEKLKHFVASLDIAAQNSKDLRRVLVVTFAEGEKVHAKATKVEEHYYIPELIVTAAPKPVEDAKGGRGGGRGPQGRGGGRGSSAPKSSPWGLTPEEKAAKKGGGAKSS